MSASRRILLVLFCCLLFPPAVAAEEEELPPVELPYTCAVESFRVLANGEPVPVPAGQTRRRDYTFAGRASNTVEAILTVRSRGAQEVRGQITFDGHDAPDVTMTRQGEQYVFRAVRTVPPFTRLNIGYFVEAKPRVLRVRPGDGAFDDDGGLTLWTSGTLLAIFREQVAHGRVRRGHCEQAVEAYLKGRPVDRFARWTAAQIAVNLADLAFAYFTGGFVGEAVDQAVKSRWVISTWKRWVAKKMAEIAAGTAFNFTKDVLSNLIQHGEFVVGDVPAGIFRNFVNGCFGAMVSELGEWEGTMPNFVAGKVADLETAAAFAAWRDIAGEEAPAAGPDGERVIRRLEQGVTEAEDDLRRRGLTGEYIRFMRDEMTVTVDGHEHRVRVLGAQWLVNGQGALLFVCGEGDPMLHKGYLVPFNGGRNGTISLGRAGITEFTPASGNTHNAELLARELRAAAGRRR